MWLGLVAVVGFGALVLGCGGEDNAQDDRRMLDHPEGGMPSGGRDAGANALDVGIMSEPVSEARRLFGNSFSLNVYGSKNGTSGCATLQVVSPAWTSLDGQRARFEQQIRWASPPPGATIDRNIRLRSGDYRVEQITGDYPAYAQLGLSYFLRGTFDLQSRALQISLRNEDMSTHHASNIFLSPLYERWMNGSAAVNCHANLDFSNEFFVANISRELSFGPGNRPLRAVLCEPCEGGVSQIRMEIP